MRKPIVGVTRGALLALLLCLPGFLVHGQNAASSTPQAQSGAASTSPVAAPVSYIVELRDPAQHLIHVRVVLREGSAQRDLQLPVWNATYQVRDFAQFVRSVSARGSANQPLRVYEVDKTTWRISGAEHGATVEYDEIADTAGPFGAQLNSTHAFFNLAMILMYPVDARASRVTVRFAGVPSGWIIATALGEEAGQRLLTFKAENYDRLVDSPVEIGNFQRVDFEQDDARYSVVIDADPADYDLVGITEMCKKIAATETAWMNDRPYDHYMFIYHFPKPGGGGGMEHAYSTAIDSSADRVRGNPLALADVTAHEFFHLWNVKRIRPQSLEPVDYTKEQYSRALWFSEGVTSAVADYVRLRAGFIDERGFIDAQARVIEQLQSRPAHLTQSAEESSLTTWFDKYSGYHAPDRSISYYVKGQVLGVLLDLAILDATDGKKSLRDVFHYLNQHYAKQGRFFDDSAGVREAVEVVSGASFREFFEKYVAGVDEIPYDDFFKSVGLRLDHRMGSAADAGFSARRNFSDPLVVNNVVADGPAEKAGLQVGDTVLSINDKPVGRDVAAMIAAMKPGDVVRVKITRRGAMHELKLTLGNREQDQYLLVDLDNITPQQRARRAVWLRTSPSRAGAATPAAPASPLGSAR